MCPRHASICRPTDLNSTSLDASGERNPLGVPAGPAQRDLPDQGGDVAFAAAFVSLCDCRLHLRYGGVSGYVLRLCVTFQETHAKARRGGIRAFAGLTKGTDGLVGSHDGVLASEEEARGWIADAFGPTPAQWARLERFAAMLVAENDRQNLIAASTVPNLWVRHIADSAQLLDLDRDGAGLWVDLGSGPGLPGLVVAILTERPMLLVESRKRRCDFLRDVAGELGLRHVEVSEARLEAVETRAAATISARAFAPLDRLIDLSARFSTESTCWLLPKGRNAVKELALLPRAWQSLFHVEHSRTDPESRILVGHGHFAPKKRGKA